MCSVISIALFSSLELFCSDSHPQTFYFKFCQIQQSRHLYCWGHTPITPNACLWNVGGNSSYPARTALVSFSFYLPLWYLLTLLLKRCTCIGSLPFSAHEFNNCYLRVSFFEGGGFISFQGSSNFKYSLHILSTIAYKHLENNWVSVGWQEKGAVLVLSRMIKYGLEPAVFVDGLCIHHWSGGGYTQGINYLCTFFYSSPTVESSESQTVMGLDGWCAGKEESRATSDNLEARRT